mgnify:CR=1 FL=1|jgi:hypothetical protein
MNAESLAFLLLALGILGTHAATLRLLSACKSELTAHLTTTHQRAESSHGHLQEMVRIGADVADALDGVMAGLSDSGVPASAVLSKPPSIQDTIMGLMLDRFLTPNHGDTTQQERAVFQDDTTTKNDLNTESTS